MCGVACIMYICGLFSYIGAYPYNLSNITRPARSILMESKRDTSPEDPESNHLWLHFVIMAICLTISFIFSALNLGLMGLDVNELKMLISSGTPQEQIYARSILPIRKKGNYLLCSILLCLTLVNAIFTTFLDDLISSVAGIMLTTITLVVIGEIIPQSLGARYGLALSAKTIYLTRLALIITFPVAYPMGKLLDWMLGEEVGALKTRENLMALIMATKDTMNLYKTEVNILTGALEITQKKVEDIMTHLPDCYMLDIDTVLDFDVIAEIVTNGYSRIPIYEGTRSNVVSVLFAKDLGVIDPDDNIPLASINKFQPHDIYTVPEGSTVLELFHHFKTGIKGHMAFVTKVESGKTFDDEDRVGGKIIGLLTMEDILEEIIQEEIVDETDLYVSNRSTRKRRQRRLLKDFMKYTEEYNKTRVRMSRQMILASFQYLSTSVTPFTPQYISSIVLMRMLQMDIYHYVKSRKTEMIFEAGKRADYFIMILEGRVTVHVGVEMLRFVCGPFTCFGTRALESSVKVETSVDNADLANDTGEVNTAFYPDYSVEAHGGVCYMMIDISLYNAGLSATVVENSEEDEGYVMVQTKYQPLYEELQDSTDTIYGIN